LTKKGQICYNNQTLLRLLTAILTRNALKCCYQ